MARLPYEGGRPALFSQQPEALIVDIVLQINASRLPDTTKSGSKKLNLKESTASAFLPLPLSSIATGYA